MTMSSDFNDPQHHMEVGRAYKRIRKKDKNKNKRIDSEYYICNKSRTLVGTVMKKFISNQGNKVRLMYLHRKVYLIIDKGDEWRVFDKGRKS